MNHYLTGKHSQDIPKLTETVNDELSYYLDESKNYVDQSKDLIKKKLMERTMKFIERIIKNNEKHVELFDPKNIEQNDFQYDHLKYIMKELSVLKYYDPSDDDYIEKISSVIESIIDRKNKSNATSNYAATTKKDDSDDEEGSDLGKAVDRFLESNDKTNDKNIEYNNKTKRYENIPYHEDLFGDGGASPGLLINKRLNLSWIEVFVLTWATFVKNKKNIELFRIVLKGVGYIDTQSYRNKFITTSYEDKVDADLFLKTAREMNIKESILSDIANNKYISNYVKANSDDESDDDDDDDKPNDFKTKMYTLYKVNK